MRLNAAFLLPAALTLLVAPAACAQTPQLSQGDAAVLPDTPSAELSAQRLAPGTALRAASEIPSSSAFDFAPPLGGTPSSSSFQQTQDAARDNDRPLGKGAVPLDANGNPIPLDMQQPARILGFMPNFRSVSGGSKPHPPGWGYSFKIATKQSFDYSSFIFLGLTSLSAEGLNEHPVLGKGVHGFYSYTWRGFLDKTDGTYLGGWLLPSLLHEDTRFYALGHGHSIPVRALYVISRQGVARTYSGRQTPNLAGLGGKVLTQIVSRQYYPTGTSDFAVLAEKFGFAAMRDVIFSSIREFYPDIAAHYIKAHRAKMARLAASNQP